MSFRKIPLLLILLLLCTFMLVGCKSKKEQESVTVQPGSKIAFLDGVEVDYDNMFFDDFTNGVDFDTWYIGKQVWGANANGGVIPENVNYTDEGVLVISGNGAYYTSNDVSGVGSVRDGSLCGGALISKFVTGPGRYEIKMKVLPRLGACSAFWTYCYDQATDGNHEIDIELPGGKAHSEVITFENVLNTNYITVGKNISKDVNVSEVMGGGKTIALNDGEWHTFGFDWYTDPETVVYYIDGVVTAVTSEFVPTYQSRLWLGVWFPNTPGFVGNAEFESDVMCVDYVQYIPFANQPYTEYTPTMGASQVATRDEYPTTPVSTDNVNKISNGNFEYVLNHEVEGYGWESLRRNLSSAEMSMLEQEIKAQHPGLSQAEIDQLVIERRAEIRNAALSNYLEIAAHVGYVESCGMHVKDIGRYRQTVDGIYQNFDLSLYFRAKGKGTVSLQFQTEGAQVISSKTLDINCDDWQLFEIKGIAPEGTRQVAVVISSVYGGEIFVDEFVLHVN